MATVTLNATSVQTVLGTWSGQTNASVTSESNFMSASISFYTAVTCRVTFPTCNGLIPAGSTINSVTLRVKYKVNTTGGTGARFDVQPSYTTDALVRNTAVSVTGNNLSAVSSPLAEVVNTTGVYTLDELLSTTNFPQIYLNYYVWVLSGKTIYINDAHITVDYTESSGESAEGGSSQNVVVSTDGLGTPISFSGSESEVIVSTVGSGAPTKTGSSNSEAIISTDELGETIKSGASESDVVVSSEVSTLPIKSGGSTVEAIISVEELGSKIVSGQSESSVIVGGQFVGGKVLSGGSEVEVIIDVKGDGTQNSDVTVLVFAQGLGEKIIEASSEATTIINSSFLAEKITDDGSYVHIVVAKESDGFKVGVDSFESSIIIDVEDEGLKIVSTGVETVVEISSQEDGNKTLSGSSESQTIINTEALTTKLGEGGTDSSIVISTVSRYYIYRRGSSYSNVLINPLGYGITLRKGSSSVTIIINVEGFAQFIEATMVQGFLSVTQRSRSLVTTYRTRNIRSARVRVNSEAINVTYKQNKATVIERDTKAEVKN